MLRLGQEFTKQDAERIQGLSAGEKESEITALVAQANGLDVAGTLKLRIQIGMLYKNPDRYQRVPNEKSAAPSTPLPFEK